MVLGGSFVKGSEHFYMTSKDSKTFKIGRDSGNGQFKPLDEVRKQDIVERVPKPGYGDTKKK